MQVSDFGLSRAAATESAMSTNTFGTVRMFTFVLSSRNWACTCNLMWHGPTVQTPTAVPAVATFFDVA